MLTDNYTGGSANNVRAEYITREGEQEYESFGWMNGHEVLYVVPAGVEVLGVKYRETGYNADMKGSFACMMISIMNCGSEVRVLYILPCAIITWTVLIVSVRNGGEMK